MNMADCFIDVVSCKAEGVRPESSEPVWPTHGLPVNLANI